MTLLTDYPIVVDFGTHEEEFTTKEAFMEYCRKDTLFLDEEDEKFNSFNVDV